MLEERKGKRDGCYGCYGCMGWDEVEARAGLEMVVWVGGGYRYPELMARVGD